MNRDLTELVRKAICCEDQIEFSLSEKCTKLKLYAGDTIEPFRNQIRGLIVDALKIKSLSGIF